MFTDGRAERPSGKTARENDPMSPASATPKNAPLDKLHAIKNEAARMVAKRMLLESNASGVDKHIAAHEADVARRLELDLRGATPYGREERLADQLRHQALIAERNHIAEALAEMDACHEALSRQAEEALAQRYTEDLAQLSMQIAERVRRFFVLWKQVKRVVKDVEELCRRHRELHQALDALRRQQGQPFILPPEARLPRSVEDLQDAIAALAALPESKACNASWQAQGDCTAAR